MKFFLLLLFLSVTNFGQAQCKSGNCTDGRGTYDFSWCLYKGDFKNGKPEGKGTMKYDDYTYTGNFVNGLEDGEGEITNNNGSRELVQYSKGIKQVSHLEKIAAKDYKPLNPKDENCISGDCVNGFGTYVYASGNKYVGNRVDYKMEGKGIFYFSNGERFEGTFSKNEKSEGTYFYDIGATYKGTYDSKGNQLNGTITSKYGMSFPYINGKPIIPPKPQIDEAANDRYNKDQPGGSNSRKSGVLTFCPYCSGTGRLIDRVVTGSTYETTHYKSCSKCGGQGMWMK